MYAPIFAGIAIATYVILILYYSVRAIGASEGKVTFGAQVWHVAKRLILYLFLPSLLLTMLLLLIAFIVYR